YPPSCITPTATTYVFTLSLHDALPISRDAAVQRVRSADHPAREVTIQAQVHVGRRAHGRRPDHVGRPAVLRSQRDQVAIVENTRSEEHTSELQSRENLVCRLLLEKKKR